MASIIERIGALAGTELSKAVDLAHHTYQDRLGVHRHVGRALVETVAEVCRNHPNLVGIGAGVLVEQLLVHEKHKHDARVEARGTFAAYDESPVEASEPLDPPTDGEGALAPVPPAPGLKNAHLPHDMIRLSDLKPRKVAFEVFGGILLLKLAATGAKIFRHKHQTEVWFAPAARIHLFSGSIATYYLVSAARSPKISAWRNAAIFFFGTDALKPILKPSRKLRKQRMAEIDRVRG
jgi:hypothetical protein